MKSKTPQEEGFDFEKIFGKELGLEVTRGSGNQWTAKGDLAGQAMRGELKHTTHESFSIGKKIFRKLLSACRAGEEPFWAVSVGGEVFVIQRAGDWIASRTNPVDARFIEPSRSEIKRQASRIPLLLRVDTDEAD